MRDRVVGGGKEHFGRGSKILVANLNAPCACLHFAIAHQLSCDRESMGVGGFLVGKFNALAIGDVVPAGSQEEIEQRHRPLTVCSLDAAKTAPSRKPPTTRRR